MLIWRTNKIIEKYNNGEITHPQKFVYYFSATIISSLSTILLGILQLNSPNSFIQLLVIHVFVWCMGVLFVYYIGKSPDPSNFIEKYFILLLPTTIKYIIIYYPIYFFLYTLVLAPGNASTGAIIFLWCVQLAAWLVFYQYIGKKIRLMVSNKIAT